MADKAKDAKYLTVSDRDTITKALAKAVLDALRKHKQAGNPVAGLRDGEVVWIPPEEISITDDSLPLN